MSSKFCKNQVYSTYFLGFVFITKLYSIFYYFRNSHTILYGEIHLLLITIFEKITLFLVALVIILQTGC